MNDYTTESLEKTFLRHHEEVEAAEKERCKGSCVYIENFSVCKALHVICKEINQLKEEKKVIEGK
jgi:hypothetical protein